MARVAKRARQELGSKANQEVKKDNKVQRRMSTFNKPNNLAKNRTKKCCSYIVLVYCIYHFVMQTRTLYQLVVPTCGRTLHATTFPTLRVLLSSFVLLLVVGLAILRSLLVLFGGTSPWSRWVASTIQSPAVMPPSNLVWLPQLRSLLPQQPTKQGVNCTSSYKMLQDSSEPPFESPCRRKCTVVTKCIDLGNVLLFEGL